MEDPWANAWGEPSKPQSSSSNWSAPSVSAIHGDHEDDISTRSWSREPTTPNWDESNITEASLWSNEPSSTWKPAHSTFDTIPLSTASDPLPREPEISVTSSDDDTPHPSSPISETPPLSLSPPPKSLHLSRPATPDAFGTLKGADEVEAPNHESWSPPKPIFSLPSVDADAWGTSWDQSNESNSVEEPGTDDELDNAWETAKEQKERQDRHVPPELLASILRQLEEMSGELWPDTDASTGVLEDGISLAAETIVPVSMTERFMPDDMTLPSTVQFAKTFISKQMTEALKLTKHAPQTRFSPMAMYMSSKGSTSWETSIKSQPNITIDDFAPAGWKIVEVAKENTVVDDGKKKIGSGLLSFFARRTGSQSDAVSRSVSPPLKSPVISSLKTESSPRASTNNMKSTTTIGSNQGSGRTTPALPFAMSSSTSISPQKNDSNPTASGVASDSILPDSTPTPSVVSRFFDRFSSRVSKPRDSLALSQDDLEFLSDVPTFNESETNHDSELAALSMMIKSTPLPTKLPPPLAPPPRPSQPARALSQATKFEQDPMNDDPFSIFNSSDTASEHTHSPMKPLIAVSTPAGGPLLNSSLPPITSPLAQSRNSGSTTSDQEWSLFGDLPASVNGILPAKSPSVAAMTLPNNSSTPPPVPKHNAAHPIVSQGSSFQNQRPGRDSPAFGSTGVISPLPPPPGARSYTPLHTVFSPSVQDTGNLDNDDDFSDFLSSPAKSAPPVPPSFALAMNFTNSSPSVAQTSTPTTTNIFDGFDDFLGPFSSEPQPPQPPAKGKPEPFVLAPNVPPPNVPTPNNRRTPGTKSSSQHKHTRTVSKADHNRTLSLLENVAARGQWLGPASPLPETLPPPVSSNMKSSSNGLFTSGSTMQVQQAQAAAALFQTPTLRTNEKNHSQNSPRQPTPAHLFQLPIPSLPKPPTLHPSPMNPTVTPEVKSGGLSAQDLSFFEGL